ncbi:MAG: type II and III secretion system protein family protein [Ahrensia sp.]|nr:type II and III secretion system protein family protein [Ahrensia sp.]
MKNFTAKILNRALQTSRMFKSALSLCSAVGIALAAALPQAGLSAAHAQNGAESYIKVTSASPRMVRLGLDKSLIVDLPADANDILVANPSVADAVTRTSRRLYLFGKEVGQTNIFVFDGKGRQIAALEIVIERDIAGLEETLARLIPNSNIRAEIINDNVVLTGSVQTPADSAKAVQMAEIFVTGGEATQGSQRTTQSFFSEDRSSQIVNLLKINGEDQVHLKVMIVEVQRAIVKQLGISTTATNSDSDGFGFTTLASGAFQQTVGNGSGGVFNLTHGLSSIRAQLNALESVGVMRTLAEPSLTAVSGETAHFKAGGSYNVPEAVTNDDDGDTEITFRQADYGVALSFTPTVLTEGRISLKLQTEVQEPTATGSTTFRGDVNLPGMRNRSASTTVELPSGGSMVIAGLIQDDVRQVVSGFPGLKHVPVFGSLFRSREFVRNESEVMVVITPYLVRPTNINNIVRPDQNFEPASDAAGMFMGRVNRVYGTKQGNLPKGRYTGSIGFILK